LGAAGVWVRLPDAVENLLGGPEDAPADVRWFCTLCAAVWLLGWCNSMVPREWMWYRV